MKHATPKAPKEDHKKFDDFPSAGPYPNITGMKKLYWGEDAYCVRCGAYVYHVDYQTWLKYKKGS